MASVCVCERERERNEFEFCIICWYIQVPYINLYGLCCMKNLGNKMCTRLAVATNCTGTATTSWYWRELFSSSLISMKDTYFSLTNQITGSKHSQLLLHQPRQPPPPQTVHFHAIMTMYIFFFFLQTARNQIH